MSTWSLSKAIFSERTAVASGRSSRPFSSIDPTNPRPDLVNRERENKRGRAGWCDAYGTSEFRITTDECDLYSTRVLNLYPHASISPMTVIIPPNSDADLPSSATRNPAPPFDALANAALLVDT